MLVRKRFEVEYADLFDKCRMGSTIWSPICGGMISGKYLDNIPENSTVNDPMLNMMKRFFWDPYMGKNGEKKEQFNVILTGLMTVAESLGVSLAVLAIAWTIKNKDVTTCLIGALRLEQLVENLNALEIYKKLTPEIEENIEKILGNTPETPLNWKTWVPFSKRR